MSADKRNRERYNAWDDQPDDLSMEAIADELYGASEIPDTGRIVGRPIAIMDIWPDMRQPRKAIPLQIRGTWDGNPAHIAGVLAHWHREFEHKAGETYDVAELLSGTVDDLNIDVEGMPKWAEDYLSLIGLAVSIRAEGLMNPITVARHGRDYLIETGERRWLAHHLLNAHVGGYDKIAAQEQKKVDLWRQAAENGARKPLNAIGMARQLALLIMDMYEGEADFMGYNDLVKPGQCDRAYYAQVEDGQTWRIKKGLSERIVQVTGLPSKRMISAYRSLLSIPDDVWEKADLENWAEFAIRTHLQAESASKVPPTLPVGNLSPPYERHTPQQSHDTLPIGKVQPAAPVVPNEDEYEAWSEEDYDDYATDELTYEDDDDFDMPLMPQRSGAAGPFAGVPAADASPWLKPHARNMIGLYAELALEMGDPELHAELKKLRDVTKKSIMDQIAVGEYDQFHEWLQGTYNSLEPMLGNSITNMGNLLNDALQALGD